MNPLTPLVRRVGRYRWLMRLAPVIIFSDERVQRLTGGRIGLVGLAGLPSLRITVTGRKTGLPRTTSLLCVPYGEQYIVTGSNWGRREHPAWTVNLIANPEATIVVNACTLDVKARKVTGEEYHRLWATIVDFWPGYEMERELAGGRDFRMFLLERTKLIPLCKERL